MLPLDRIGDAVAAHNSHVEAMLLYALVVGAGEDLISKLAQELTSSYP